MAKVLYRKGNFWTIILIFVLNTVQFSTDILLCACIHFGFGIQTRQEHAVSTTISKWYVTCYTGIPKLLGHECCRSSFSFHVNNIRGWTSRSWLNLIVSSAFHFS